MDITFLINDRRKQSNFSKYSFSNYKKKEILDLFEKNLILSKQETSCFLGVELHLSFYTNLLFEILFINSSIYINIDYPNLPNKLYELFNSYNKIIIDKNIDYRNNQEIRNIIANLISIVSISPKNNNFQLGLLSKLNSLDFEHFMLKKNIQAKSLELTKNMFFLEDTKEIVLVLNEIAYLLRDERDTTNKIVYWLSWLVEYEKKCNKDKIEIILKPKKIENISDKNAIYWEWNLWNIILTETQFRNNDFMYKQIYSLYNFYKFNFKKSYRKKYLNYIFHAIYLLKKNIDFKNNPIENKYNLIIKSVLANNFFYRTIFEKLDKKYFIEENKTIKETLTNDVIKNNANKESKIKNTDLLQDNLKNKSKNEVKKVVLSKKAQKEQEIKERMQYLFLN